jgi:hypothetical protein
LITGEDTNTVPLAESSALLDTNMNLPIGTAPQDAIDMARLLLTSSSARRIARQ